MKEADHKRKLVREINVLPGAQARRLEDRYAVGLLDLIIKLPGLPACWAECKIVDGNLFAPTPAQFEEGEKWIRASMPAILIGWKDGRMYLSPWVKQADVRTCYHSPGVSQVIMLREYLTWRKQGVA